MPDSDWPLDELLVLGAADVQAALDNREGAVIEAVERAYLLHREGRTDLPHSSFLRFGDGRADRIIALPGRIEDEAPIAGIKWIASFPGNVQRGMARASALLIVNSTETGRPTAVIESSIISAQRTAASAALAARELHAIGDETTLGLIGCGVINFEIARFVLSVAPRIDTLLLYDLDPARAETFATRVRQELGARPAPAPRVGGSAPSPVERPAAGEGRRPLSCRVVADVRSVFAGTRLVSFATVASTPHVDDLDWSPEHTVLHVSLRDLSPRLILQADNVTDDIDHVLRANTSLHLTEPIAGNRDFVRCALADILAGAAPRRSGGRPLVFSPFGLGILDLALARLVVAHARANGTGVRVADFLPAFTG
jgi:ornithine cyclodeaminase/alanine dehydrogenase-like protein (mu-crystallin family)